MFHSENGLFFQRTESGVRVVKTSDGRMPDNDNVILDQTVQHGSWCSAVCSVSTKGESGGRFYEAQAFHG